MTAPATTPIPSIDPAAPPPGPRFRLDRDRFDRMVAAAIFGPAERVDWRDGVVLAIGPDGAAPYRFTVDQFQRLDGAGILSAGDRVELLEGWLIAGTRINPPHRISSYKTRKALEAQVPPGWYVDEQKPLTLPRSGSEPLPDVQVPRGQVTDYLDRHPGPADVSLVVEVTDASLTEDGGTKKRLYASEGISSYWIVNLRDHRLEVHTEPDGPDYRSVAVLGPGDTVTLAIDGVEAANIAVRDLLP